MRVLLGGNGPQHTNARRVDDAHEWPFRRDVLPPDLRATGAVPPAGFHVHIANLHRAFPSGQVAGTRLILTQSTYQLQRWLDWEAAHPGALLTADASGPALRQRAPEAFVRRGPWSRIQIVEDEGDAPPADATQGSGLGDLHEAFLQPDPLRRRHVCLRVLDEDPHNPAVLLALGSTAMELQDVQAALDAAEEAVSVAPDWEATHFELGKVWLRADDTPRAAEAFGEAARLMPTFAAAWSNLGAALGELERPDDALVALRRALEHDPQGHPTLNNLGVVLRDLGQFVDAAAAFRQVVAIAPAFVFGRYNLAQTLLLARDYGAAREEYEGAFARDPQKSPRQACRLAIARAATGDGDGAVAAMEEAVERLTGEPLAQALDEAERMLSVVDRGTSEIARAVTGLLAVIRRAYR